MVSAVCFLIRFKQLKLQQLNLQETADITKLNPKITNVFNCWTELVQVQPGQMTDEAGARSMVCLNTGIQDLIAKKIMF